MTFLKKHRPTSHTLLFLLLVLLCACDTRTEWRDGDYQLRWIDTPELFLTYTSANGQSVTLVDADVVGIGANQEHIVVLQRRHQSGMISYFIIKKQPANKNQVVTPHAILILNEQNYLAQARHSSWPRIEQEFHYP